MSQFDDLLIDPPILDTLRVDEQGGAFVVTFVPTDELSAEPKLTVTIPVSSVEGSQIKKWLTEFCRLLCINRPVVYVVHSGGSDFMIGFADDSTRRLSDPALDSGITQRIYDGLKYVSQAAENAYRIVQINLSRTA